MRYLVTATGGPGFSSLEEAVRILEGVVLPGFDALVKLEAQGKIVAGGLPVGERSFVWIAEASSNEELDGLLRALPIWGLLSWNVTPLQSFQGRASIERAVVQAAKK